MENLQQFKKLADLQQSLMNTSSLKKKKELLERYKSEADPDFAIKVFDFIVNPHIRFHVSADSVLKCGCVLSADSVSDESIIETLSSLSRKEYTGNEAAMMCASVKNGLNANDVALGNLFLDIIDKDFGCGVAANTLQTVFDLKGFDTVNENFGVALANKYFDRADKVDFASQDWYASRKCDGVRCIAIKKNGVVRFFSRQHKEFLTLGVLKAALEACSDDNFALDGELCIVDVDGNEDFIGIVKLVRRKDFTIPNPFYQMFDKLTLDELYNEGGRTLSERLSDLCGFYSDNEDTLMPVSKVLKQTKLTDTDHFNALYDVAKSKNWEGLMIRRDVPYEGKRTNNLLKVKDFMDDEFTVIGYELGYMRMVEDGRQVTRHVLTNVFIDYKGNKVGVGSGFNKQQRIRYAEHPEYIMGKTITVKYFEETTNQKGGTSMRFPTVQCVYEHGDRDI